MTDATASQRLKAMNTRFAALAKASPQALGAFRSLMLEASKAGALQAKFKELVAVAIAVHQVAVTAFCFMCQMPSPTAQPERSWPRRLRFASRWEAARVQSMRGTLSRPTMTSSEVSSTRQCVTFGSRLFGWTSHGKTNQTDSNSVAFQLEKALRRLLPLSEWLSPLPSDGQVAFGESRHVARQYLARQRSSGARPPQAPSRRASGSRYSPARHRHKTSSGRSGSKADCAGAVRAGRGWR
jgi:hypothetical protein